MDAKVSAKTKTKTFQNLNKNCPLLSNQTNNQWQNESTGGRLKL